MSTPSASVTRRLNRQANPAERVKESSTSEQVIARMVKRADAGKARAAMKTKKHLQSGAKTRMHSIDNERVHDDNESARQVDERSEIDRDSEIVAWRRPSSLTAPAPRPGYSQRWVRYPRNANAEDADNLEKALDQGWRPRLSKSVRGHGHALTADLKGKYAQFIVTRGLMLMEIPEQILEQRNAFYRRKQERMTRGIDQNMFKLNDRRMPFLQPQRSTRVTKTARRGRLEDNVPGDDED